MATMDPHNRHGIHGSLSYPHIQSLDSSSSQAFNVSLRPQPSPHSPGLSAMDSNDTSGPLPNPPFVFPARQIPFAAPASFSRATGRRPMSAIELTAQGSSSRGSFGTSAPAPLPSFSFNQSTLLNTDVMMNSPPQSPSALNVRAGGHRRVLSEFIGGDGKTGTGTVLMSTSPTRAESELSGPAPAASLGPSAGRRGHAHRRSAAISCHDLSMVLKPPQASPILGGSAPTSPSENEQQSFNFSIGSLHGTTNSVSELSNASRLPIASPPESPRLNQTRARVGFSDTLEFIPRPLSVVSSDASSTMTMRPGHSLSGSISSILSLGQAGSTTSDLMRNPAFDITNDNERPSTAGAVLDLSTNEPVSSIGDDTSKRRNSTPSVFDDPDKDSTAPVAVQKASKKYIFFGHSERSREGSPSRSRPASSAGSDNHGSAKSPPSSPLRPVADEPFAIAEEGSPLQRRVSHTRKPSKKQKKVKSWAGSILSRKSRPRASSKSKAANRRSPTPPLHNYEPLVRQLEISSHMPIEDTSALLKDKTQSLPQLNTTFASWKPRHISPLEDDTMSPMIDLDAALGPFNTPTASSYDADWEASQRSARGVKKRMHSGAVARGHRGESPFHRRSESAPEMDNPRFSLHRLGSNSTMADVFEEEEEDEDWEYSQSVSRKSSQTRVSGDESPRLSFGATGVDSDSASENAVMDWDPSKLAVQRGLKRKGSGLSEGERRQISGSSAKSVHSATSLKDEPIAEEPENHTVAIVDDMVFLREDCETRSTKSSDSTVTPPQQYQAAKDLAAMQFKPEDAPQPFLTPASPHAISFQSPFPSPRSPISYDAQRISTAPSSFTEEHTFESLLLGEPGPELRMSVDDVPSLTSSNSTLTRESMYSPGFGNPQFRDGQRSHSLSAPSTSRKRSSIASLSRLLHSSSGEKSPLSTETRAPDSPDKKDKTARNKRFSRMMQFWKPKDMAKP